MLQSILKRGVKVLIVVNCLYPGPPRNFKQLGHIADTEGRLKGFGIGAQKTMMIGDQVIGYVSN